MNWNNYGCIILIITFVLSTTIEARGGRGGGGRSSGGGRRSGSSSGSRSSGSGGGGGFWSSLFGGSSSSSKSSSSHSSSSSSSSNWKPPEQPSYNPHPYYHHTTNYENGYGSRPPKTSDSTDYLNGYMTGNFLSHDLSSLGIRGNSFNTNSEHKVPDSFNNGYTHPRLSVITNNQPEPTATTTTTEMSTQGMLDILDELNKPFDSNESLESFLNRMQSIDFTKIWPTIYATALSTPSTTSKVPNSSTELPNTTTESTTMSLELTSSILQNQATADNKDSNVDTQLSKLLNGELLSSSKTSPGETLPATTESAQEANLDISTPNGLICSPIIYNEVNEFGVNLTIERLACYPALEPVVPLE